MGQGCAESTMMLHQDLDNVDVAFNEIFQWVKYAVFTASCKMILIDALS